MRVIYFQPPGIDPKYCEAGTIHKSDPDYIWYIGEPCKILVSDVTIIPNDRVRYDKKINCYVVV